MPLPDERPRQSVANLIGRFEQQTKRQSLSPAAATPRSLSVSSHITGDSAKEEVKEKREWPPKSTGGSSNSVSTPPSSWTRSTSSALFSPQSTSEVAPQAQAAASDASPSDPPEEGADPATSLPSGEVHVGPSISSQTSSSPPPPISPVKSSASKATNKPPAKPTAKPAVTKPPPRQSLTPSVSQPLKPQHTGPSATSAGGARKPIPRTAPSTPSRAKTPSRPSTATARPKTPTTTTRPKTPSTGLFAPTAASLARARNAQPQLPTPTRKVTLSSSSADRLSKPTAASLNRARTPTAVSPPLRGTGKATPRGGAMRGAPRASMPGRLTKDIAPPTSVTGAAAASVAGVGIAATLEAEDIPDEEEALHADRGHHLHLSGSTDVGSHEDDGDPTPTQETSVVIHSDVAITPVATDVEAVPDVALEVEIKPVVLEASVEEHHDLDHKLDDSIIANETGETLHSESDDRVDGVKPHLHITGDELEDIVNLLESVPPSKSSSESIASIPDEVHEIPDEE